MSDDLIAERGKTHGDFREVAEVTQKLNLALFDGRRDATGLIDQLSCTQGEAIHMICVKLARIVCGDPNHPDHWDDIAGYARLGKGQGR